MYEVKHADDTWGSLELLDTDSGSAARVAPGRGGMLTGLRLRGRERLYLDLQTLADPSKNVRGGNPVLFPTPGKLDGDLWSWRGKGGSLKQHGFARNLAWAPVAESCEGSAAVTLRLVSGDATRPGYPFEFVADYSYELRGDALRITQRFENRGDAPMPFAAGFHPYFHVRSADKGDCRVQTRATRAFDNVTKREVGFGPLDLTLPEVDLHLLDHGGSASALETADGTLRLLGSPEFTHWVIWTLAGRDFVCLEPWTAPGNALNTGERLIVLAPGEERELWLEISAGTPP